MLYAECVLFVKISEMFVKLIILCFRSHMHLFGALKRLQLWHNANITVLHSNKFDMQVSLSVLLIFVDMIQFHFGI